MENQYFRYKYKPKTREQQRLVIQPEAEKMDEGKVENEEKDEVYEVVTLGVQHRGKVSTKEATRVLRVFWPKNIVKEVEVKRRVEIVDVVADYQPLWITVTLAHGYTFENYLDWPLYEENWPDQFDKGLFKEESDWV